MTAFLLMAASACATQVGTGGLVSVPKDAASTCATHCSSIGLSLDSVVIMANNVGCVCRGQKSAASSREGASTAGGMAAMIVDEQQRQQQQQQQQTK